MDTARIRSTKPHLVRAGLAGAVALAGSVVASFGDLRGPTKNPTLDRAPVYLGVAAILIGGVLATRALSSAVQKAAPSEAGGIRNLPLARLVRAGGYAITLLWVLATLEVGVEGLLLGGALTGVILGIAAQQTLGNVFAGIVLLAVRPFTLGGQAVIKSSLGEYEGTVTGMGFFYVTISTPSGRVDLPNAIALASAVGPGTKTAPDPPEEDPSPDVERGGAA